MISITKPSDILEADWQKYLMASRKIGLPENPAEVSMLYFRAGIELAKYTFHTEDDAVVMTITK